MRAVCLLLSEASVNSLLLTVLIRRLPPYFLFFSSSCCWSWAVSLLNPQFRVRGLTAWTRAHPLAPCTAENVLAAPRNNPRRGWHAIQFSSAQISDPLVSLQVEAERVSTLRQPARDPPHCYFKEKALNDVHKILSVMEAASRWTSWPKFRCIWLLFRRAPLLALSPFNRAPLAVHQLCVWIITRRAEVLISWSESVALMWGLVRKCWISEDLNSWNAKSRGALVFKKFSISLSTCQLKVSHVGNILVYLKHFLQVAWLRFFYWVYL